jgi:septum formation inhibitor MinC
MIPIENAQTALQTLQSKDADILKWCENIQITTIEQQHNFEDILTKVKSSLSQVEATEDSIIKPANEIIANTRNLFKPYKDKLKNVKNLIVTGLDTWRKAQLEVNETKVIEQAKDYWDKRKEAQQTGEVIPLPDLSATPPPTTSHHNMGVTSYRTHIKVRVVSPNLVPRQYCMPSESLLRKAGEIAVARKEQPPIIDGAIIEIEYIPVSRLYR